MANESGQKKSPLLLIVIIIVIAGGVVAYFTLWNKKDAARTKTTNLAQNVNMAVETNTTANPSTDLSSYDGKMVNITSADGKVTGKIGFAYKAEEAMPLHVVTFLRVTDDLPKTTAPTGGGAAYYYIASHAPAGTIREGDGTGVLSPAYCNTSAMPNVLALAREGSVNVTTYDGCSAQYEVGATTSTFYHTYAAYYNQNTFDLNEILSMDAFVVFDSAPFYKISDNASGLSSADPAEVLQNGTIAAEYALSYSE